MRPVTKSPRAAGFLALAVAFAALLFSATPALATSGMFRMYNPYSGEHFYTASFDEASSLENAGWRYEGIGWIAPDTSSTPVYRLYSGTDHHYTTDLNEKNALERIGWKYEGIGWYSDDERGVPLYRQFNPYVDPGAPRNNSGSHNYTADKAENDALVAAGWKEEGIGWYGVNAVAKAIEAAKVHLEESDPMYTELVTLLILDGYDVATAQAAADQCGADWYKKAAQGIFNLVNWDRSDAGLDELVWDEDMYRLALERCPQIAKNFSHDGAPAGYGENIVFSSWGSQTPNERLSVELYKIWLNSKGHYDNYMDPSYTRSAVALGTGTYRGMQCVFGVQLFR
jgi:hypothetical protein